MFCRCTDVPHGQSEQQEAAETRTDSWTSGGGEERPSGESSSERGSKYVRCLTLMVGGASAENTVMVFGKKKFFMTLSDKLFSLSVYYWWLITYFCYSVIFIIVFIYIYISAENIRC